MEPRRLSGGAPGSARVLACTLRELHWFLPYYKLTTFISTCILRRVINNFQQTRYCSAVLFRLIFAEKAEAGFLLLRPPLLSPPLFSFTQEQQHMQYHKITPACKLQRVPACR
eukprot:4688439-Pleurochrysis_carterae.AAC.2